jgi:hypothetical protein
MLLDDTILLTHPFLQVTHALLQCLQLLHMHTPTWAIGGVH